MKSKYISNQIFCLHNKIVIDIHCLNRFEERFYELLKFYIDDPLEIMISLFEESSLVPIELIQNDNVSYYCHTISEMDILHRIFFIVTLHDGNSVLKTCYNPSENSEFASWFI